jgi:hypothetical protein
MHADGWMDEQILGYTCMHTCMYVCMYGWIGWIGWIFACMHVCVSLSGWMYGDGHMYVDLCMHVCKNAWASACIMLFICMYECMCFGSVALLRDAWLGFRNFALLLCRCCVAAVAHLLPSIARSLSLSLWSSTTYLFFFFLHSIVCSSCFLFSLIRNS